MTRPKIARHSEYCRRFRNFSSSPLPLLVFALFMLLFLEGCSFMGFPARMEGCKTRTYINAGVSDYVSHRYDLEQAPRMAIIPFDVPENFAPPGDESFHYGRELARILHQEMLRASDLGIVELFNRDRWPGKRADFVSGNYQAVQLARNAGYDLVLVGYLEDIVNDTDLTLQTKIIDTSNGVTLWYARTLVYSNRRPVRGAYAKYSLGLVKDRPDLFAFPERADELAKCTVSAILNPEVDRPGHQSRLEIVGRVD